MEDLSLSWQQLALWASIGSVVALLLTLIAVPWVVARLPADYFSREQRTAWGRSAGEPWFADIVRILKNLGGAVLVLLGVVMLFTPGQGLLTLLAGLLLMNFPGKYRLERYLVMRPGVLKGMNWLRRRSGRQPFESPAGN
jgi:amino acid transporter